MINLKYNQLSQKIEARFHYEPGLVLMVKEIGATAVYKNKKFAHWEIELNKEFESKLAELETDSRFEIDPAIRAAFETVSEWKVKNYEMSAADSLDFHVDIHPAIDPFIKGYQRVAVEYIQRNARGVLLGDEMGLGKTLSTLAAVTYMHDFPTLIVCPAVVKLNWRNEIKGWLPNKKVYVFSKESASYFNNGFDFYVINYDLLEKYWEKINSMEFKAMICDESHYLKNHKAGRTLRVLELSKNIKHKILLSGTPVLNSPSDLISQLQIIGRLNEFGGFWGFANKYCNAYKTRFGWDFSGSANLEDLNKKLRESCYVRREKRTVLKELPEKRRVDSWVWIDNAPKYKEAESDLIAFLKESARLENEFIESIKEESEENQKRLIADYRMDKARKAKRAEAIVKMNVLSQIAAEGKLKQAFAWIDNYFEENPNKKLVVFAWHKHIIESLQSHYGCNSITGETTAEDRSLFVDRFQNDDSVKLLLCNIQAGGVGITLTAADTSLFIEQGWNPGTMEQAEDRTHRIGQKNPVTVYYLLGEGTIDRGKWDLIEEKRLAISEGVDGFTRIREWFLRNEESK